MLIELAVENWRGFDKEVCLDLRAIEGSDSVHLHHAVQIDQAPVNDRHIHVLPIAGIYGANSAGKSNLIAAIAYLSDVVFFGEIAPDAYDSNRSTTISVVVKHLDYIMQYGLSVCGDRVVDEWLLNGLPNGDWETVYDFDTISEQDKKNVPYLGNYDLREENKIADAMWDWFLNYLVIDDFDAYGKLPNSTLQQMEWHGADLGDVAKWLAVTDSTICEIERVDDAIFPTAEPYGYLIHHKDSRHEWAVNVDDESTGVQRALGLYEAYAHALAKGQTLIIDNFCEGMHPTITRAMCLYFTMNDINKTCAQLIFTSHELQLFDHYALCPDEIFFVDTQAHFEGNTGLYSLCDFKKLKGDYAIHYMGGRYEALPSVSLYENLFVPKLRDE